MHIPVLLKEVIRLLDPRPGEFFIDGTVNGGGHARAVLSHLQGGTFLGCEWDAEIYKNLRDAHLEREYRAHLILKNDNYACLPRILKKEKLPKADGLLLDLGFSSTQLLSAKGLSFNEQAHGEDLLDMRYSRKGKRPSAAQVTNSFPEAELTRIFYDFGEERYAQQIAHEIITARKHTKILHVNELVAVIKGAVGEGYERGRIHPATRVFQALRIYVNDELGNLETTLIALPKILKSGGRAAIISFHSLEDRLVKNYFRAMKQKKIAVLLNKKPITAETVEVVSNPRSRSAKLRVIKLL